MARYRTFFALVAIGGITRGLGEPFEATEQERARLEEQGIPLESLDESDSEQAKGGKPAPADAGTSEPASPREKLERASKKADLAALAAELGVEVPSGATVADIRAAVELHLDALDGPPPAPADAGTSEPAS